MLKSMYLRLKEIEAKIGIFISDLKIAIGNT